MELRTNHEKYILLENLGMIINHELKDEFSHLNSIQIKKDDAIKELLREQTDEEIMRSLSTCGSFGLVTTEECNFRCKYCVYSGKYKMERAHGDKRMKLPTAKKAVDTFYGILKIKDRTKKRSIVYLSFYGGESLLEIQLVKDAIIYARQQAEKIGLDRHFDVQFRLNTNGFLLEGDTVDFLKEYEVMLDISLDGPASEHDRFRITSEGKDTWKVIVANLKLLKKKYPDYYERRVNFLVTLHPLHDAQAIEDFFTQTPELFENKRPSINLLSLQGLNEKEAEAYKDIEFKPTPLHWEQISESLLPRVEIKNRMNGIWLTNTCFPGGDKIMVTADGKLTICERISQNAPGLGHVDCGFDFDSIRHILKEYNRAIIEKKCWECPVWSLCTMCLAKAFDGERFHIDCDTTVNSLGTVKTFIEKKESEENLEHAKIGNSVHKFIELL